MKLQLQHKTDNHPFQCRLKRALSITKELMTFAPREKLPDILDYLAGVYVRVYLYTYV